MKDQFGVKYTAANGARIMRGPIGDHDDAMKQARELIASGASRVVVVLWSEPTPAGVSVKAQGGIGVRA